MAKRTPARWAAHEDEDKVVLMTEAGPVAEITATRVGRQIYYRSQSEAGGTQMHKFLRGAQDYCISKCKVTIITGGTSNVY